jgi:hypothetical protein
MTKPAAEAASEMRVVAKTAGISDLAEGLPRMELFASLQMPRRLVQAKRLNKMREGRSPYGEQLLKIAHRDASLRRDIARREVEFGVPSSDNSAKTGEQLVALSRDDVRIRGCEHRPHKVVDDGAHIRLGFPRICLGSASRVMSYLEEQATGERPGAENEARSTDPAGPCQRL